MIKVLKKINDLEAYLKTTPQNPGCFADTGFLYGLAYNDDRLFERSCDVHDVLVKAAIPIYTNVITRVEFIDLIFRKQVTNGCLQIFNNILYSEQNKEFIKLLRYIRDKNAEAHRKKESYKIDERRLKDLRKHLRSNSNHIYDWSYFSELYVGTMLETEWTFLEQELGLNFVEVLEGQISPLFNNPVNWRNMVQLMSVHGQRGFDAMIVNLFLQSRFPLLITSDKDIENCLNDPLLNTQDKAILIL